MTTFLLIVILILGGALAVFYFLKQRVEKALVADVLDPAQKGTAFGWFYLASGLPLLPASWLFGEIWERVSPLAAFGASALCAACAAVLMLFWVPVGPARSDN